MSFLEFECRPPIGGYSVVAFDTARLTLGREFDAFEELLAPDATDDERYLVNRWGRNLRLRAEYEKNLPQVVFILRPRSERTRRFDLLKSGSSTFLEFAQTPQTVDDIKALADRYGPLEGSYRAFHDFNGHNIGFWMSVMREMSKAVELWAEAKKKGDFNKLIRVFEKPPTDTASFLRPGPGVAASLLLQKDSKSARLVIRPNSLLDALWIQFALAIDGSKSLRSCVVCKKWFAIEAGRERSKKKYCSDACRMRAYRKRKGKQ